MACCPPCLYFVPVALACNLRPSNFRLPLPPAHCRRLSASPAPVPLPKFPPLMHRRHTQYSPRATSGAHLNWCVIRLLRPAAASPIWYTAPHLLKHAAPLNKYSGARRVSPLPPCVHCATPPGRPYNSPLAHDGERVTVNPRTSRVPRNFCMCCYTSAFPWVA